MLRPRGDMHYVVCYLHLYLSGTLIPMLECSLFRRDRKVHYYFCCKESSLHFKPAFSDIYKAACLKDKMIDVRFNKQIDKSSRAFNSNNGIIILRRKEWIGLIHLVEYKRSSRIKWLFPYNNSTNDWLWQKGKQYFLHL